VEYEKLASFGLTDEELDDMKGQVKGQIVLSLEATSSRLHRLAGTALYDEPFLSIDEMMRRVDAVTREDIAALAAEYFDPNQQVVVRLGPE
jgi:predicted Zn-dependent peptidase